MLLYINQALKLIITMTLGSDIANFGMVEAGGDPLGHPRQAAQHALDLRPQFRGVGGGRFSVERILQRVVQIFLGIQLRSVGRRGEHFDFVAVFRQPIRDAPRRVRRVAVGDQEHLLARELDQPAKELREAFAGHGSRVGLEKNFAFGRDRTDDVHPSPVAKAAKSDEPQAGELYEQIGRLKVELEWLKKSCPEHVKRL